MVFKLVISLSLSCEKWNIQENNFKKDRRSEEKLILLSAIHRMKQRIFYLLNKQLRQYYRGKNEIKS